MKLIDILKTNADSAKNYIENLLEKKQDALTFDTTPTVDSTNPVTSDGIKKAIDAKAVDLSDYYTRKEVDSVVSTAIDTAKSDTEAKIPEVDTLLSTTSENPVQNKVITEELNKKFDSSYNSTSIGWTSDGLKFSTGSSASTVIDASTIICADGEGTILYIAPQGVGVKLPSSDDEHGLLFGEKLEYGTPNNRANIATESYVDSAISKALSSISDGDGKSY